MERAIALGADKRGGDNTIAIYAVVQYCVAATHRTTYAGFLCDGFFMDLIDDAPLSSIGNRLTLRRLLEDYFAHEPTSSVVPSQVNSATGKWSRQPTHMVAP